jgi:hypothetical protein
MNHLSIRLHLIVVSAIILVFFVHDVDSRHVSNDELNGNNAFSNGSIYIPFVTIPSVIFNGDFEKGPVGWGQYSEQGWPLILNAADLLVPPHSGNWAVWLGGDYDEIAVIWQTVAVPKDNQTLHFWHWNASEDVCGYDVAGVVIDLDEVVDAFWLCTSTNTGGWVRRSIDLANYAGQSVEIDILVGTDETLNSNLFIDDVSLGKAEIYPGLSNEPGGTGSGFSTSRQKEVAIQAGINRQGISSKGYEFDLILHEMQKMLSGPGG